MIADFSCVSNTNHEGTRMVVAYLVIVRMCLVTEGVRRCSKVSQSF